MVLVAQAPLSCCFSYSAARSLLTHALHSNAASRSPCSPHPRSSQAARLVKALRLPSSTTSQSSGSLGGPTCSYARSLLTAPAAYSDCDSTLHYRQTTDGASSTRTLLYTHRSARRGVVAGCTQPSYSLDQPSGQRAGRRDRLRPAGRFLGCVLGTVSIGMGAIALAPSSCCVVVRVTVAVRIHRSSLCPVLRCRVCACPRHSAPSHVLSCAPAAPGTQTWRLNLRVGGVQNPAEHSP